MNLLSKVFHSCAQYYIKFNVNWFLKIKQFTFDTTFCSKLKKKNYINISLLFCTIYKIKCTVCNPTNTNI